VKRFETTLARSVAALLVGALAAGAAWCSLILLYTAFERVPAAYVLPFLASRFVLISGIALLVEAVLATPIWFALLIHGQRGPITAAVVGAVVSTGVHLVTLTSGLALISTSAQALEVWVLFILPGAVAGAAAWFVAYRKVVAIDPVEAFG